MGLSCAVWTGNTVHTFQGDTKHTPSLYLHTMGEIAHSTFDVITILNAKMFVLFIFSERHCTKYTKNCTNPKFPTIRYFDLGTVHASSQNENALLVPFSCILHRC